MGEFVNMTALRRTDPEKVAAELVEFAANSDLPAAIMTVKSVTTEMSAIIVPPTGEWTVVSWSRTIPFILKATRWLSDRCRTVASMIDIYDSEAWSHAVFENGEDRDRYASEPDLKTSDWTPLDEARRRWRGDAQATAAVFGCSPSDIEPYFVDPNESQRVTGHKAHIDDVSTLDDSWVAVDFWRKLGIDFPRLSDRDYVAVQFPDREQPYPIYDTTLD
jgi:hypothetical protein